MAEGDFGTSAVDFFSRARVPSATLSGGVSALCLTGFLIFDPDDEPRITEIILDWALVIGFVTGIVMTLLIAWRQSKADLGLPLVPGEVDPASQPKTTREDARTGT